MNFKNKALILWLLSGATLVAVMVVIGGITRLTHSGLSMVDWKLFMGAIPPLNDAEWLETFNKYKQFPEYQVKHTHFTIEDFKSIFFWEYLHRMIGRLLGIVFIVPFVIFLTKGYLNNSLKKKLYVLFFLGAFQGFLGWFMVKSGLVDRPEVSHYRLAAHLISAFTLFCYIAWLIFEILDEKRVRVHQNFDASFRKLGYWLLTFTVLQIIYGAFVAGLKAGLIYNTYPKMGDSWIAESIFFTFNKNGIISLLDNMASVQFIHRIFGHIVVIIVVWIFVKAHLHKLSLAQNNSTMFILLAVLGQFCLGVFTLMYAVPVWMGVLHQLGALIFLGSVIYYIFRFRK